MLQTHRLAQRVAMADAWQLAIRRAIALTVNAGVGVRPTPGQITLLRL